MSRNSEPIPSREATTAQQLSALLAIARSLEPWLMDPVHDVHGAPAKLDGGAASAALATFVKTCDAIDKILDDSTRWNLDKQNDLYSSIVETQKCQQEFLKAQTISAAEICRPSFQIKPSVVALNGGYVAFWGDPYTPGAYICGRGATPAAALIDFDAAFQRAPKDQITLIFESQQTPPTKRKPKK